jgi:hypothetical protein
MTAKEQEEMFKRLKEQFPRWSDRFLSGYVHGIVQYELGHPLTGISNDEYGRGMILAFAVRTGVEAEQESYFARLGL